MSCTNAIALFDQKNISGAVKFHQCAGCNETTVMFELSNLKPNQERACHIHEYGDETEG